MQQIREEQERILKTAIKINYQDRMIEHVEKFFPDHFAALGQENTRALIDYGVEKAGNYQIISERDVCIYIDLMLALGVDFDESGDYPWAEKILTDDEITNPLLRINAVHDKAMDTISAKMNRDPL